MRMSHGTSTQHWERTRRRLRRIGEVATRSDCRSCRRAVAAHRRRPAAAINSRNRSGGEARCGASRATQRQAHAARAVFASGRTSCAAARAWKLDGSDRRTRPAPVDRVGSSVQLSDRQASATRGRARRPGGAGVRAGVRERTGAKRRRRGQDPRARRTRTLAGPTCRASASKAASSSSVVAACGASHATRTWSPESERRARRQAGHGLRRFGRRPCAPRTAVARRRPSPARDEELRASGTSATGS